MSSAASSSPHSRAFLFRNAGKNSLKRAEIDENRKISAYFMAKPAVDIILRLVLASVHQAQGLAWDHIVPGERSLK